MSTATAALAIAGTAAQTVAAISDNMQAEQWAMYLGLATVGLGVANGIRSVGKAAYAAFRNRSAGIAGGTLGNDFATNVNNTTSSASSGGQRPLHLRAGRVWRKVTITDGRFTKKQVNRTVDVIYPDFASSSHA